MTRIVAVARRGGACSLVLIIAFLAVLFTHGTAHAQVSTTSPELDLLLDRKQYDKLEQALQLNSSALSAQEIAYFNGIMANRLNQIERSKNYLEPLVPVLMMGNAKRAENAICTLADDYAKSYRYSGAARTYAQAAQIAQEKGTSSICDASHEARRWALLHDMPPQTVAETGAFSLKAKKDSVGLIEVPVQAGDYKGSWILDTGANLSVISRSVADQMGLTISASGEDAEGASGIQVPVRVGLIAELRVGPAVIRNVPVLIAADSDLSFPALGYHISGCLGLPVLAALGTVTVSRNENVSFGNAASSTSNSHNLFLDRLTPVVVADMGHGNQLFTVDTGAIGTILSSAFYGEGNVTASSANMISLELSGAGGSLVTGAYEMRDIATSLADHCVDLRSALLLTEKSVSVEEFYGNLGQSLLQLFDSYSFDFQNMHFSVTGGTAGTCADIAQNTGSK